MCVCVWKLKSLKEPDSLDAVDCRHITQNTEEEEFGFMLTAEELNGVFLGPNKIPIVIDDEVRPLVYICGFLLIDRLSRVASSLLVAPIGRHVWGMGRPDPLSVSRSTIAGFLSGLFKRAP